MLGFRLETMSSGAPNLLRRISNRLFKKNIAEPTESKPPKPKKALSKELLLASPSDRVYQDRVAKKLDELFSQKLCTPMVPNWEQLVANALLEDAEEILAGCSSNGFLVVPGEDEQTFYIGLADDHQGLDLRKTGLKLKIWNPDADLSQDRRGQIIVAELTSKQAPANPALELSSSDRLSLETYDFPIDAVYLWVDGSDPKWAKKFGEQLKSETGADPHGTDSSRFLSSDELKYSIASLRLNAPWIRNIFVVTDNQVPVDVESFDNVTLIDHTEIIPEEYLPTFNSNVISLYLKFIPGLSNHFLYLNDDVFLGKPTEPSYFFDRNGVFKVRLTRTRIPGARNHTAHVLHEARANTIKLAAKHKLITTDRSLYHGPHPMRRDLLDQIHELLAEEIKQSSKNKFRSANDLVIEWFHFFYGFTKQLATYEHATDYAYLNINSTGEDGDVDRVLKKNLPRVFALNQVAEISDELRATEAQILAKLQLIFQRLSGNPPGQ